MVKTTQKMLFELTQHLTSLQVQEQHLTSHTQLLIHHHQFQTNNHKLSYLQIITDTQESMTPSVETNTKTTLLTNSHHKHLNQKDKQSWTMLKLSLNQECHEVKTLTTLLLHTTILLKK